MSEQSLMPKFRKRKGNPTGEQSSWFVTVRNHSGNSPPVWTFQLRSPGIRLLSELGLDDEDAFPKREFQMLQDLGLVYTLGDSDVDDPSEFEFAEQDGLDIPPDQRVEFVIELLREYTLDDLNSESFARLLSSIDDGPAEPRERLIKFFLTQTPIEYAHIDGVAGEESSDPGLYLGLVCYAFEEFVETLYKDIQGFVTPMAFKREWVYLFADEIAWDLAHGLCKFYYTPPESCLESHLSDEPVGLWTEHALERTHTSQFLDDIHRHLKQASKAVDTKIRAGDFVLIVPRQSVSEFNAEDCLEFDAGEN